MSDSEAVASPSRRIAGIPVLDLRSEQDRANERDGVAGRDIPVDTEELYEILVEADEWGRANRWPSYDNYPQHGKVRAIGRRINDSGGFDMMQRAAYHIKAKNPRLASHLEQFWHGIGNWLA